MKPVFETTGTCLNIKLPEELDHPASELIRRESDRIMGKIYIRTICFDFGNTVFMDSSGVGLIMGRYRALGMRSGCMKACHVSGYIEKLLRLSGVSKFLELEKEGAPFEELEKMTLGSLRRAVQEGDVKSGSLMAGQIAGMIKEERSCEDIIKSVVCGASRLMNGVSADE